MGTVVEKYQYLEGTKQAIKKAIKNKGVDVSDTDTFRSYAEKIKEIGSGSGGNSVAEYFYQNKLGFVEFPSEKIETSDKRFVDNYSKLENLNEEPVYVCPQYGVNSLVDKDTTTGSNGYVIFKFPKKAICNKVRIKVDADYPWSIYATDNLTSAERFGNSATVDTENGVLLYENSESITTISEISFDNNQEYTYYCYRVGGSYSKTYELSIFYYTGIIDVTLKSPNMTPILKGYPEDYMQVVTQDWHNGGEIIPSQTLTFRPYKDGGCLVNYTDDGKATNLKMYLLNPTGEEVVTEIPFVQPVLTENGTIGGDAFAVEADSVIESGRPAWKAFDGNTVINNVRYDQWHSGSGQPHWIMFYNPNPLSISKITIFNGADNVMPLDWQFQYSDDNNDWHTLVSGTNTVLTSNGEWSFDVTDSGSHKYYRFYTTSGAGNDSAYLGLTEIQITGKEIASVTYDKPIYVLSPDDSFTLDGYEGKTKVADLNIPAHIYFNGTDWVMGE